MMMIVVLLLLLLMLMLMLMMMGMGMPTHAQSKVGVSSWVVAVVIIRLIDVEVGVVREIRSGGVKRSLLRQRVVPVVRDDRHARPHVCPKHLVSPSPRLLLFF